MAEGRWISVMVKIRRGKYSFIRKTFFLGKNPFFSMEKIPPWENNRREEFIAPPDRFDAFCCHQSKRRRNGFMQH
jgi:hypothetical protein